MKKAKFLVLQRVASEKEEKKAVELAEKLFILTQQPHISRRFLERPCSLQKIHVKANNDEKKAKP